MEGSVFVTITGMGYCYGMKPFEVGRVIRLIKEPENAFDPEAIRAELPFIGKIGYVANSPETVARGTCSAGRIYDRFGQDTFAVVMFITRASVICLLAPSGAKNDGLFEAYENQGPEDFMAEEPERPAPAERRFDFRL